MKKEQVVNCQFSVWYPIFKKHTIKSLILPLPQNVIDYLLDDGTLVVSGSDHNTQQTHTNNSDSDAEEDVQWSDDDTTSTVTAPEFPEFTSKVVEAINALGGRVFPKLNWSAPRDANWIALNSSLQCDSLSDIFLLFKSSDFITHDLTQPFLVCSDQDSPDPVVNYELVLRKWSELIPGGEFRCFVKENKLIAVSQRDYTQHYPHLLKQEEQLLHAVQEFFSQHIQYKFPDEDCVCVCVCVAGEGVADRREPVRGGDGVAAVQLGGADVRRGDRPAAAGRPGVPLHHQRGDGAAQPLSELPDPARLRGPLARRGRLQTHRLPQAEETPTGGF
ncbi:Cell division cycle protein 123 [Liparis tanakae]|uniref:Translation initiation factor eIF2 assembly protein n=1 Tax=Liparis tanakae TaxID=230148 RepID=A0A4Z2F4N4_9TELE|nr:Cell division cycle protein 123 [Liparis tanakae]